MITNSSAINTTAFSESLITAQSSNNKPIDYKMKRSANDAQKTKIKVTLCPYDFSLYSAKYG